MRVVTETNTYLSIRDEYGKIKNQQYLIISKSGGGKSLFTEGIAEKYHNAGFVVCVIADPKDELEFAYQMFPPSERYHLDLLKKVGKVPTSKKVKLYHPFTFNLPNNPLPEINFYTFSLKDFSRSQWSLLAETGWDKETVKVLLQASNNISKEDGLYGLMHYVRDAIRGKESGGSKKPDPKNFFLETGAGTMKSVAEVSNYLQPFKKDYFLVKDSCDLNLNWENILTDQQHYHVFVSNFIQDEKVKDFLVLSLLNSILKNRNYLKKPIIVIIPEIRKQCPFKPEGHKIFLASAIKNALSLMRSSGRGMSSLLDSQVFSDIDEDIRNSATKTFFGELGGGSDMERVGKAYNYKRETRDLLKKTDYPYSFILVGNEDMGGWKPLISSSCHAEEHYNFFEMYKKQFPDKMQRYSDLVNSMKKMYKEEEEKSREKAKRREKEIRQEEERKKKEREERQQEKSQVDNKEEKIKKKEQKSKLQIMKLCWEMYNDPNLDKLEKTFRRIADKFELSHPTAKTYVEEYDKIIQKKTEESGEVLDGKEET